MITFDEKTQAILDNGYAGADVTRRRMTNFAALEPARGDHILDLGCGQGLLTESLARAVGPDGFVTGVEPSPEMRATAVQTTRNLANVAITAGDASSLPLEDSSQDRAVSLQVFEYVPDVPGALLELARVLRPNGRLVIGDIHWGTLVMHSEAPTRTQAVLEAWDAHLHDPVLPARLPTLMRGAGFVDVTCTPLTFVDTTLRPDGMAAMFLVLIESFLRERASLPDAEISAWASEQRELADAGAFFFSLTHFVTSARKA